MMPLTFTQAAQELGMSERWLRDWLASNPVDAKGVPFYIPMGRRKEFEPADIDRIRAQIRENEKCRLSSTAKAPSGITAEQLGRLAAGKGSVARATPRIATSRRAKLPTSSSGTGKVLSMAREPS
jgi:hypothetical protein